MVLKRRTPQNIVWGGAAGCMPVLIGWAAVTGSLSWAPRRAVRASSSSGRRRTTGRWRCGSARTTRAAGVPMLPVVADAGDRGPADRRLLLGDGRDVAAAVAGRRRPGRCTRVAAVVLGAVFLREAHRLLGGPAPARAGGDVAPMRLFHWSITYLALLFLAVAVDQLLPF